MQRSINGGVTFAKITFATAGGGVTGLVPKIQRNNEDFYAFCSSGVWRSVDDGLTWTLVQAGAFLSGGFDNTGLGVAVTAAKVYTSRDSGLTWAEVTTAGNATKDACFGAGYKRVSTNVVRNGTTVVWEVMDTTANVTDILFVNAQLGYKLRGTAIDRTLNGGYSWETLSVSGSAPTWLQMQNCGGRLGIGGGVYFGFYSPFFDATNIARVTGSQGECVGC